MWEVTFYSNSQKVEIEVGIIIREFIQLFVSKRKEKKKMKRMLSHANTWKLSKCNHGNIRKSLCQHGTLVVFTNWFLFISTKNIQTNFFLLLFLRFDVVVVFSRVPVYLFGCYLLKLQIFFFFNYTLRSWRGYQGSWLIEICSVFLVVIWTVFSSFFHFLLEESIKEVDW